VSDGAIYRRTKHFHWQMSGAHFREYPSMLDEQANRMIGLANPDR
jgi:starvation-inducible DNA-binding protein